MRSKHLTILDYILIIISSNIRSAFILVFFLNKITMRENERKSNDAGKSNRVENIYNEPNRNIYRKYLVNDL